LREGLFIFVDLLADVPGELFEDGIVAAQQVSREQCAYQNGEEHSCRS
jgi:hypothetical protein